MAARWIRWQNRYYRSVSPPKACRGIDRGIDRGIENSRDLWYAEQLGEMRCCRRLASAWYLFQDLASVWEHHEELCGVCHTIGGAITSLYCPVSQERMTLPVRGRQCTHLQCFDGATFLRMNYHRPRWLCPVCRMTTRFRDIEIDRFVICLNASDQ